MDTSPEIRAVFRVYKHLDVRLFEYLIDTASDKRRHEYSTIFYPMCELGMLDHIKILVKHNLRITSGKGWAGPLYHAAMGNQYETYKYIYEAGISTRIEMSQLEVAVRHNNLEFVQFILSKRKQFDKKQLRDWLNLPRPKSGYDPEIVNILERYLDGENATK